MPPRGTAEPASKVEPALLALGLSCLLRGEGTPPIKRLRRLLPCDA